MQFIHPSNRQEVFNRIYNSLEWGGAFIFFEKTRANDARFQDYQNQLYSDFKLANGFDESEIINKTRSLKGILEPFSSEGNHGLLERAGFIDYMTIFKSISFQGFLAIK
jgi:tRNA (cmo5U34)-methyltransferase